MKRLFIVLALLFACLGAAAPAMADTMDSCPMMQPTIQSLRDCVQHAASMGLIDNAGVAQSLLATIDAAQVAVDHGLPATAANILQAFIYEVQAQSGVHIDPQHAAHMVMHAQMVIAALGG